jgi:glutamine amidotransferase
LRAREGLSEALDAAVRGRVVPFLGICVGLQLLVTIGEEHGTQAGLDWLPGRCRRLDTHERLPHMGWTRVETVRAHPVLDGATGRDFYFAHSYAAFPDNEAHVLAVSDHGGRFPAALASGSILGVQFHPEKSQKAGLELLSRFLRWTP